MRDQFFPSPISGTEIHPITIRNEICKNRKRIQRSISISSRFRVDEMRRAMLNKRKPRTTTRT